MIELGFAKQRRTTRMPLNRALKCNSATGWNRYKEAQKALKNSIKLAKRSSWKRFCKEINSLEATSKLRQILVKKRSQKLGYLRSQSGRYTENDEETLNHMLEVHFPGSIQNSISGRQVYTDLNRKTRIGMKSSITGTGKMGN